MLDKDSLNHTGGLPSTAEHTHTRFHILIASVALHPWMTMAILNVTLLYFNHVYLMLGCSEAVSIKVVITRTPTIKVLNLINPGVLSVPQLKTVL